VSIRSSARSTRSTFFFFTRPAIHALLGVPVSHDANRLMALGEARLNRVAWSSYGSIWRWFGRNDEKTLRAMKAVDYLVHHDEQVPAIIVACVRWNTYGPISGSTTGAFAMRPPLPRRARG